MYTEDKFTCGICSLEMPSINTYVTHMLQEENCILVMETSSYLPDITLPRFKRQTGNECTNAKDQENMKFLAPFSVEVDVGEGQKRWKCKICCLTFSRHAALYNHFKLTKHGVSAEDKEVPKMVKHEEYEDRLHSLPPHKEAKEVGSSSSCKEQDSLPICPICGQIFKSMAVVLSHTQIVHSQSRPFHCSSESCTLRFKTKGSLLRHMRRHTGDRPYKCDRCGRAFRESGSLLRHRQSKIPCNEKTAVDPPRYGITLPFEAAQKKVNQIDCNLSLKKEKMDDASHCETPLNASEGEETKSNFTLEFNEKSHLELSNKLSKASSCDILERKTQSRILKEEHSSLDSSEEKGFNDDLKELVELSLIRKSVLCPVCQRVFSKKSSLVTHLKSHLADMGNECWSCKKLFNTTQSLLQHIVSHSSVKQFECRECGKAFKLRCYAVTHAKTHSTDKTVACPECGRLFKTVSSRNMHLKIHRGEKDFECGVCFKKFTAKASLVRHLHVHSGERPYACQGCGRSFKERGTLMRHLRLKPDCSLGESGSSLSLQMREEMGRRTSKPENLSTFEESERMSLESKDEIESPSEFASSLNDEFDAASISNHSDLSFCPEDYLIPDLRVFGPLPSYDGI